MYQHFFTAKSTNSFRMIPMLDGGQDKPRTVLCTQQANLNKILLFCIYVQINPNGVNLMDTANRQFRDDQQNSHTHTLELIFHSQKK